MASTSPSEKDTSDKSAKLEELRSLVLNDKNLISRTDDIFLLSFLRARKYNTERAFQLIKNYYSTRRKHTELFRDLKPSAIQECLDSKTGGIVIQENVFLGIGRCSYWKPEKVHIKDIVRNIIMELDYLLQEDLLQENKMAVIFDAAGLNWKHLLQLTPKMMYMVISALYACYPIRYSHFHIINENPFVHAVLVILSPFLPQKLKSRIQLHGSSFESLKKFIEPKYLPADYGGELPPFDPSERNAMLKENEEFFVENEKYWTVEKQL